MQAILSDLFDWFQTAGIDGVVVGGVAVSLLSRPRFTRDADALVMVDDGEWPAFLRSGEPFGFTPRIPDALGFARKSRVLLMKHSASGLTLDLALGCMPFEQETIRLSKAVISGGITVRTPRPEHLIVMKAVAHRPQDLVDIQSILDAHPRLNRALVRRWVRQFANVLDMPELVDDLEKLLRRSAPARKKRRKSQSSKAAARRRPAES